MEISTGVGVGPIKFGMKENEVVSILGSPDDLDELEGVEGEGDWYRELYYFSLGISLSFNSEDDFKLGNISITGSGHTLFGLKVLGTGVNEAKELIATISNEIPVYEDCTWGKPEVCELLSFEGLGLMLWFKSGVCDELICSYLF